MKPSLSAICSAAFIIMGATVVHAGFFHQFFGGGGQRGEYYESDDGHAYYREGGSQAADICKTFRCPSGKCVDVPKNCPCPNELDKKVSVPGGWYICVPGDSK
jgi:hypothetical protein